MRYSLTLILLMGAMSACANSGPPPVQASQVNPVIEQRIIQRVEEGRAAGTPDLRDMPVEAPEQPTERELAAERQAVLNEGQALAEDINAIDHPDTVELTAKAEALKAAIERDKKLIEDDKVITDRLLRGDTVPQKVK